MLSFLSALDRMSFWIGFAVGVVTLWLLGRLRAAFPVVRDRMKARIKSTQASLVATTEARLRSDMHHYAQKQHIASVLFSLDEILIKPRLLAPPAVHDPASELPEGNILAVPYMPDWPEPGTAYHAPTLTLPKALEGGANLVLVGEAGSGKTVALAHLTSLVAQRDPEVSALGNLIPLYLHAADFLHKLKSLPADPLDVVYDTIARHVSALTLPRLPGYIRDSITSGQVILLLDGLDELPHDAVDRVVELLDLLLAKYPGNRVVAAAAPDYCDGLTRLGFATVAMTGWEYRQKAELARRWGELWNQYIIHTISQGPAEVDPLLINAWLLDSDTTSNPLELTLRLWGAYAGDVSGANIPAYIDAYLLRMTVGIPQSRLALEKMASQMVLTQNAVIAFSEAEKGLPDAGQATSAFDANLASAAAADGAPAPSAAPQKPGASGGEKKAEKSQVPRVIPGLVDSGLLVEMRDEYLSFVHPIIMGYLAGASLGSSGNLDSTDSLSRQENWTGKNLALQYLSACVDTTKYVMAMLEEASDPLYRELLTACRWLRDAARSSRWRTQAMRQLALMLQKETLSMSLRARIMAALVASKDAGVVTLFRQMLPHRSENIRIFSALGVGMLRDVKSVKDLEALLDDPSPHVAQAAVMALSAIGTREAIDAVAGVLLGGSEEMRRVAAEALACNPEDGYAILKEGAAVEDLLVRRAVVYGMARVGEEWAIKTLEKIEIEDGQWVVRSAATMALEEHKRPDPHIPKPVQDPAETPWVVQFASKQGMGVSPGKPATDLLLLALKSEDDQVKMAALDYFARKPEAAAVPLTYQILYGPHGEAHETAFNSLWHMAAAGTKLPPPMEFGLG